MSEGPIKVVTGEVRLSYCKLWEPEEDDSGVEWYKVCVIIPKSDKKTVKAMQAAIEQAKAEGKGLWGGKIPSNLKTPLRDGDDEREDNEAFEDSYFFNCKTKFKPIMKRISGRTPDGKAMFSDIDDEDEIYSGVYARVSVNVYPFNSDKSKTKGVACGLNSIVKIRDGEPLGGGSYDFEEDFGDMEVEDDDDIF